MEKLTYILERIDSRHLATLWSFFRDYFSSDGECMEFLYLSLYAEPSNTKKVFHQKADAPLTYVSEDGQEICDRVFIPRRMLNAVQRFVSVARDVEQIRHGKDVFKIVFIVTCVETLQMLSGKSGQKKELLFSFFTDYISRADKDYISSNFKHYDEDSCDDEDSFRQFIGVINEYRNCAAHEGAYWDYCFNNNKDDHPVLLVLQIDLQNCTYELKQCYRLLFQLSL